MQELMGWDNYRLMRKEKKKKRWGKKQYCKKNKQSKASGAQRNCSQPNDWCPVKVNDTVSSEVFPAFSASL